MERYTFKLPDIGEGIAEAEIVAWHAKAGDTVSEDQPLVDVMTEKATVEISSPVAGKLVSAHGAPGESLAIGAVLAVFETSQERVDAAAAEPPPAHGDAKTSPGSKPLASPATRRKARDLGLDLHEIAGSGPEGRITAGDLDAHLGKTAPAKTRTEATEGVEEIRLIGMRRIIAKRLQDAKRRIPHFSYIEEIDVTALEGLRAHLNAAAAPDLPKLTPLAFVMLALVKALQQHRQFNALFDDEAEVVRRYRAVHIGIATQGPNGLAVPVIRHAEARDLWSCAGEVARLSRAVRDNKAGAAELTGSTITVTSLGAIGGIATTPVINAPEIAIIGVNKIAERLVIRGGQIVIRKMMNLSSSFDHRVVDGADAALFVQTIKTLLEQPATLFIAAPRD